MSAACNRKQRRGAALTKPPPVSLSVLKPPLGWFCPGPGTSRARASSSSSSVLGLDMLKPPPVLLSVLKPPLGCALPGSGTCAFDHRCMSMYPLLLLILKRPPISGIFVRRPLADIAGEYAPGPGASVSSAIGLRSAEQPKACASLCLAVLTTFWRRRRAGGCAVNCRKRCDIGLDALPTTVCGRAGDVDDDDDAAAAAGDELVAATCSSCLTCAFCCRMTSLSLRT